MSKTIHVVPDHKDGWNVKSGGASLPLVHTETKADAISRGREISRNQGAEFYIHDKHGVIRQKDSHGPDSYPPRG